MEIQLFFERNGSSYTEILARTSEDGGLTVDQAYGGTWVKDLSGDYDEEFHYIVRPEHRDNLVLELVRALFGGDDGGATRFRDWLKEHEIPYRFASF